VVVHPAIDYQELLAAGGLYVRNPGYVDPSVADKITSRFYQELGSGKTGFSSDLLDHDLKTLPERLHCEVSLIGKIAYTETASEIDCLQRSADKRTDAPGNLYPGIILVQQHSVVQYLSSRENVDSAELKRRCLCHLFQHGIEVFLVDSKGKRFSAHAHGAALNVSARIDTQSNAGA
jgi:hypothetical protein